MAVQPASLEVLEKAAVPPAQARAIVQAIEIEIAGAKDTLASRQDMLILRHEMAELRTELRQEMKELRTELRQEMNELRTELRQEMGELRTELRQDMAGLRHSFELRLASTVTQPQLYAGLLGQMALLLGIAYFFVTHLQH
jgi:chromosome segregation ATPase